MVGAGIEKIKRSRMTIAWAVCSDDELFKSYTGYTRDPHTCYILTHTHTHELFDYIYIEGWGREYTQV